MEQHKPIINWWQRRKQLSVIANLINIEMEGKYYVSTYSPISLKLIKSLSITSKLQGFILLKSLLRFSDLYNFDLISNTRNERFHLIQNKTAKLITKEFIIQDLRLKSLLCQFHGFEEIINYQVLSNEIKRFIRGYAYFDNITYKHSCHIFRHLEASWQFSKEIPITFIARELGDLESTVKNYYIHKELLALFS